MTRLYPVLAFAVLLAACGREAPKTPPAPAPAASPAIAGSAVVDPKRVPAAFQGVWAATEEDCAKVSETRLTVGADSLTFYESHGPVGRVEAAGPDEIIIHVPLTGEGETSERTFRYRLINGGSGLFDVRNGLTRIRCPAT
ncbi:MAG: hypothetical protein ACM3W4_05540 [Ignavibacteriales bacterium]